MFVSIIKKIFYFVIVIIICYCIYKLSYILYTKNDINDIIEPIVTSLLTVFSIFFGFLLQLCDKLLNIDNLKNKTKSEKIYFLKEIFENRRYKIIFHFYTLLITIILLIIILFINKLKLNKLELIIITVDFVIVSFLTSISLLNEIIFVNKEQVKNEIYNNK